MPNYQSRFTRWASRLGDTPVAYLVKGVQQRALPVIEQRGYAWATNYGSSAEVAPSTIPLQRQADELWPTIQITFSQKLYPHFSITFAELPPVSRDHRGRVVPREKSIIHWAPACFMLCKGTQRSYDGYFGYQWFSIWPRRRLEKEIGAAISLLHHMLALLDEGLPSDWSDAPFGSYVDPHVMILNSYKIQDNRKQRAQGVADQ